MKNPDTKRIFANKPLLKLWKWLLDRADHPDRAWQIVTKGSGQIEVEVMRGQLVFGRGSAAREMKEKDTTVYKRLKKLEDLGFCGVESDKNGSIVTINNYEKMLKSCSKKAI